jgi:ABC-2 type transport system permease protein
LGVYYFGSVSSGFSEYISVISPGTLAFFGLFFVLGYLLYSTLYAGVGAVCSTDHEAQQLQVPIVMLLIIPIILTIFLQQNPESTASMVLSFIPFFTPMVMFMRINSVTPPIYEIILSIVLLVLTVWLMVKLVGKIFRIGILMYGKRPTLPEILKWVRYE